MTEIILFLKKFKYLWYFKLNLSKQFFELQHQ